MKIIALLCWLVAGALCAAEDKEKLAPVMPSEVTLTSGRVLRNVQVIRWEKDRVVLKHSAGADPIAFTLFKSPTPAELPAMKVAGIEAGKKAEAEAKKTEAETKKAIAAANAPRRYDGQIFIVTRGAGNYKLGGVIVRIYYKSVAEVKDAFKWGTVAPKADDIGTSDAEGKFSFEGPPTGPITIVAKSDRLVGRNTAYDTEKYLWVVSVDEMANRFTPILSTQNHEDQILQSGAYESL